MYNAMPHPFANDCFALPPGVHWTPVDKALALLQARLLCRAPQERVPLAQAAGRFLAKDVCAVRSHPPRANAAVDGYGLAGDVRVATVIPGRAAAGRPFQGHIPHGQAVRILTGAMVPDGVDRIALQEEVTVEATTLTLGGPLKPDANIRKAGEDMQAGALILPKGHRLSPQDLGTLASAGVAEVVVYKQLKVAVLSTGDEVVDTGSSVPAPSDIRRQPPNAVVPDPRLGV